MSKTAPPAPEPLPAPAPYTLTVTHDFGPGGPYAIGTVITGADEIRAFLDKWPNFAVKRPAPPA